MAPQLTSTIFHSKFWKVQVIELHTHTKCGAITKIWKVYAEQAALLKLGWYGLI